MRAYSMDLRERVLADLDGGMATGTAAAKYRVSPAWVRRLRQRRRETGETAPRRSPGRTPQLATQAEPIRAAVARTPDATLAELKRSLGLSVALSTLWRAIAALGLTLKKRRPVRRSRIARMS